MKKHFNLLDNLVERAQRAYTRPWVFKLELPFNPAASRDPRPSNLRKPPVISRYDTPAAQAMTGLGNVVTATNFLRRYSPRNTPSICGLAGQPTRRSRCC